MVIHVENMFCCLMKMLSFLFGQRKNASFFEVFFAAILQPLEGLAL